MGECKAEGMEMTKPCLQRPPRSVDFGGEVTAPSAALHAAGAATILRIEVGELDLDPPAEEACSQRADFGAHQVPVWNSP